MSKRERPMSPTEIRGISNVVFPPFRGVRWQVMPFVFERPHDTIPDFHYAHMTAVLIDRATSKRVTGVGYITVDEAVVPAGQCHRRPGLHVDGAGFGGGGFASTAENDGMIVVASHDGCVAYELEDFQVKGGGVDRCGDGDAEHLRPLCASAPKVPMVGGVAYHCGPRLVHESLPMSGPVHRQFLRISFPSLAPWYEGFTPSPYGVVPPPGVATLPRRPGMDHRPTVTP